MVERQQRLVPVETFPVRSEGIGHTFERRAVVARAFVFFSSCSSSSSRRFGLCSNVCSVALFGAVFGGLFGCADPNLSRRASTLLRPAAFFASTYSAHSTRARSSRRLTSRPSSTDRKLRRDQRPEFQEPLARHLRARGARSATCRPGCCRGAPDGQGDGDRCLPAHRSSNAPLHRSRSPSDTTDTLAASAYRVRSYTQRG
jgi:hypothetical protein